MVWRRFSTAGRFLVFVAVLDLASLAALGAICWFGSWHTARDYGNGLTYAGLALLLFGALQFFGTDTIRPIGPIRFQAPPVEVPDRGQQDSGAGDGTLARLLKLGCAGLILIVLGQVLVALAARGA